MNAYVAEFLGTAILILLGNGVVANVLLVRTKGHDAGWIAICAGWGLAVYTAVLCVQDYSGAHINPAVTIGLAAGGQFGWEDGQFGWELVLGYIGAQMAGAIVGAVLVYVFYKQHYDITEAPGDVLGTFCTGPNIRGPFWNLLSEILATFVLVYAVFMMTDASVPLNDYADAVPIGLGSIGAIRVGLVVFAIGLCLGGTTGYAINPARDLGPRIVHALLPIKGKRGSDWSYAPIPVVGPILGGLLAAGVFYAVNSF